jgi:acyl-[acyl-carrier-protein]-phospholipid O-acyltransferase / long-chain-fatty-acid--[acyl-carrier-protein] ligase
MAEVNIPFKISRTRKDLFRSFLDARRKHGGSKTILVDGDERRLTYTDVARASFALGSALSKRTGRGEAVGLLLPTGAGAVIAFYSLIAAGRVPAMLNFTSGSRNLIAACKAAEVKRIITARKFVELGKLEDLMTELSESCEIIYLEEVREGLTLGNKIAGALGPVLPGVFGRKAKPTDPGVVLFTSGTEGNPKGVVLTHQNILANVYQVLDLIALDPATDVLFNPLPTFHCFGLTVGAVVPITAGVKGVFHPTPLQPREIAKRIRKSQATILLATDTFISQYARAGDQDDLRSLRLAVCGAERVRDETRSMVKRKYDIEILEGYGVTEAAPVVAANKVGNNQPGTVGVLMAGMECRLEPVEGIDEGGRLFVRGPNVMKGYLRAERPGEIDAPPGGWHDTGDIASVEPNGNIRIKGRIKRFAKIGGEMVSLTVVENCASAIWPDDMHAAANLPDKRKGEQIVLLSTAADANRADMLGWAQNHGVPELAVPRHVYHVEAIPVLGTGKVNFGAVQALAKELTEKAKPLDSVGPLPEAIETSATEPDEARPAGAEGERD